MHTIKKGTNEKFKSTVLMQWIFLQLLAKRFTIMKYYDIMVINNKLLDWRIILKEIKFGIMGAGKIAKKFCDAAKETEYATVTAISSKSEQRANEFAKKNNIAFAYSDYEEMLKSSDIDVVYIATTNNFHFENIMQCITHNKHVLCEKSMVMSEKDAKHVFKAAADKNLFIMEAMWSRFLPTANKAKLWIESGKIGIPQMANIVIGFCAENDMSSRFYSDKLGGGALFDIGVYAIENTMYLLGSEIKEITHMISCTSEGVDKVNNITLRIGDCIANLQCTISANTVKTCYIYGTNGYVEISHFVRFNECTLYDNDGNEVEKATLPENVNGFIYEIQEVVNCINQNKQQSSIMPAKTTIDCCKIYDLCLSKKN